MTPADLARVPVLVTTGGTSEPIDDVRAVTNFSTGRFGLAIADAFADLGADVTVTGSRLAFAHAGDSDRFARVPFASTEDLASILSAPVTGAVGGPVIVHAAAVSDYRPVPVAGKISSSGDELVVRMVPTPKLIDGLRDTHGKDAFLVGFKLLSGVTDSALVDAAHALCRRARLNLVVANDLTELRDGQHPCWLVTAEGGALRVEGSRVEVAAAIAAFVARRRAVTWAATNHAGGPGPDVGAGDEDRFASSLTFAQDSGLLIDTNGNTAVTTAVQPGRGVVRVLVSPRQVDKATAAPEDRCIADVDLAANTVTCWGVGKSSIDTSVQARLIAGVEGPRRLLHSHSAWGRTQAATSFPYPCGAAEEAGEVLGVLEGTGIDVAAPAWHVELVCHGTLYVCDDTGFAALVASWERALRSWRSHVDDIAAETGVAFPDGVVMPIFDGLGVVGVVAETPGHEVDGRAGVAVFVDPSGRGSGVGRHVVGQLVGRRRSVVTVEACGVVDYWASQGFEGHVVGERLWRFDPPPVRGTHPVLT